MEAVAALSRHEQYYSDPATTRRPRYWFPEGMNLWWSESQIQDRRQSMTQMARGESGALSEYEPCPRSKHYPDWDDEDFQLVCDALGWEWRA